MRIRIILLFGALIAACGDPGSSPDPAATVRDSAGVRIVESAAPNASSPSFEVIAPAHLTIGEEDGPEELLLNNVSDVLRLPDGRIVIANSGSYELRVFDASGRYLRSVGRMGGGPGEFSSRLLLFRHEDEVYATDDNALRIHAYDLDLQFRETRRFEVPMDLPRPFAQGVLSDKSLLAYANHGGGTLGGAPGSINSVHFSLVLFDSTGQFLRSFGTFDRRPRYVLGIGTTTSFPSLPLTVHSVVRARGAGAVVLRGQNAEIELWSTEGALTHLLRWPRERTRTADAYPRIRDAELERLGRADERTRLVYGTLYKKDLPLPEFVPLYQDAIVDEQQRIWVERYRTLVDDPKPRWDVIDTTGRWLGTVETPRDLTVHQIGRDFLLGVQRDSLGVERVVMHRVQASP